MLRFNFHRSTKKRCSGTVPLIDNIPSSLQAVDTPDDISMAGIDEREPDGHFLFVCARILFNIREDELIDLIQYCSLHLFSCKMLIVRVQS